MNDAVSASQRQSNDVVTRHDEVAAILADNHTLRRELWELRVANLFSNSPGAILVNFANALAISIWFYARHPMVALGWAGFMAAMAAFRAGLTYGFKHRKPDSDLRIWTRLFALGSALTGGAWSSTLFLFGNNTEPLEARILTVAILAASLASVALGAAYLPAAIAFVICAVGPMLVYLLTSPDPTHILLAGVTASFGMLLVTLARRLNLNFVESHKRRLKLEHMMSTLKVALAEADTGRRLQTEFLANVSHEIRTPMSGVIGMLDLAEEARDLDRKKEYLAVARRSATALVTLINDILDLSRLEAGRVDLRCEPFAARSLVTDVLRLLEPSAASKGIVLKPTFCFEGPGWVDGDAGRIRQVLLNLVGNAIKFTDDGTVEIVVNLADGKNGRVLLGIDVIDTGEGIDEDEIPKMFERFAQADGSHARQHQGTGLGLAICRQLVKLMQGDIGVISTKGQGSMFWFTCWLESAVAPVEVMEPVDLADDEALSRPINVLVVDDNPVNRLLLRRFSEKLGWRATDVDGGARALEALANAREPYDVVLMDVQMPGMDGVEATGHIRALETEISTTPVIAVTANAMEEHRQRYLASGMDGFVAKPIDLGILKSEVERVLKRPATQAAASALIH